MTKLIQTSTIACSSSTMLDQSQLDAFDTLVSTGSTRRTCRVVTRRDVTSQVEFGLIIAPQVLSILVITWCIILIPITLE